MEFMFLGIIALLLLLWYFEHRQMVYIQRHMKEKHLSEWREVFGGRENMHCRSFRDSLSIEFYIWLSKYKHLGDHCLDYKFKVFKIIQMTYLLGFIALAWVAFVLALS